MTETAALPARVVARSVSAALLMSIAGVIPTFLAGSLAVQIQADLGFGSSELGAAVSLFFVTCTIAAALLGKHVDTFGWGRGLRIAAAGSAVTLAGIAALAESWLVFVAFMLIGGVANAISTPSANLTIARVVPMHRRALMFGVKQSAVPASIMLAGFAVPVIGLTIGWRWAFAIAIVCPLLAAAAVPPLAQRPPAPPAATQATPGRSRGGAVRFMAAGMLGSAAQVALASFLVVSSVESGVDEGLAGLMLACGSIIGIFLRVSAGWAADRRSTEGLVTVVTMLVLGAIGLALLSLGLRGPVLFVVAMLAFAGSWGWTGLFHFAVVARNPDSPGRATGYLQAGLAGGATVGPLVFGLLADHVSFSVAWQVTAAMSLAAAALVQLERRAARVSPAAG